jgi:thioredoxin-related protein
MIFIIFKLVYFTSTVNLDVIYNKRVSVYYRRMKHRIVCVKTLAEFLHTHFEVFYMLVINNFEFIIP